MSLGSWVSVLAGRQGGICGWSSIRTFYDFVISSCGKQWGILLVVIGECCFCRLLTAKSQSVRGLSEQPAFMGTCLTINGQMCLSCPSSRWTSPCVLYPLMIGPHVVPLTFFWAGEQVSMVLVPWELMLFWGMGVKLNCKIMSNYSREVKWQQRITTFDFIFIIFRSFSKVMFQQCSD